MRTVAHGVAYFADEADDRRVQVLMQGYCSARRTAYQALRRGLKTNDARKAVKVNYGHLGQRYINDAVSEAARINQPKAVFGGRRAWKDMQAGKITKEEWQARRNNTLYSRGDRTKQGNPNLRIVGDELWINDPAKRGQWIRGRLWLNKPADLDCYEVRIQRDDDKFQVTVSWETEAVPVATTGEHGVVGLDVNPDGVAVVVTNDEGCPLDIGYVDSGRAMFARKGKRTYDVRQLAVKVVAVALATSKHIVVERLRFKNKASRNHRWNRTRHNFLHRQMVEAIRSRATRHGVGVIEVNPAFTSVIGNLKYADQYGGMNRHTAAALVIARLGMGLKEVIRAEQEPAGKKRVTLEGRSRRIDLTAKALSWMGHLFVVRPKPPGATPPHPDADNPAGQVMLAQSTGCEVTGTNNWSVPSSPEAVT